MNTDQFNEFKLKYEANQSMLEEKLNKLTDYFGNDDFKTIIRLGTSYVIRVVKKYQLKRRRYRSRKR